MAIGSRDYAAAGFPTAKGGRSVAGRQVLRNYAATDHAGGAAGSYAGSGSSSGPATAHPVAAALPSAGAVDYAHKLGQATVLWGGLAVFGVVLASRRHRAGLLRGLMRKHVTG